MTQPTRTERRVPPGSKLSGSTALLACAACCALPLLLAAGLLTGIGAAVLERTLVVVAAGLAVVALGLSGLRLRRRSRVTPAAATGAGCGNCSCGC